MPQHITIRQGESVQSIAYRLGFSVKAIWDHPDNADLKNLRVDGHILYPGDVLSIPDKEEGPVSKGCNSRHQFKRKDVPSKLELRMLKNYKPRKGLRYRLVIDETEKREGSTDGDGWIREPVSPAVQSLSLTLLPEDHPPEEFVLKTSHLDPIDTVEGIKARLANLGYFPDSIINGEDSMSYRAAITAFRKSQGLPPGETMDRDAKSKLKALHHS